MLLAKRFVFSLLTMFVMLLAVNNVEAGRNLVTIETNLGDITLELYQDQAPDTVANFLSYVDDEFYTNLIFHRVIEDFMTQGGVYDPNLYEIDFSQFSEDNPFSLQDPNTYHTPNAPIALEDGAIALENQPYTIAMARSSGNDTATSQFFINFEHNEWLDGDYAVFGEVIDGFDVVDAMNGVENIQDPDGDTDTTEYDDVTAYFGEDLPAEPIIMNRIYRVQSFEDDTSSDFEDVDYLKATEGGIRTFVLKNYSTSDPEPAYTNGDTWNYEFTSDEVNGVNCLKWHINDGDSDLADKTFYLARNTDGEIYIFKEVRDEGTSSEQVIFEASNLLDIRAISYYSSYLMQFKIIEGAFDSDDLSADANKIVLGSGSNTETQQIISFASNLSPNFIENDVVVVKVYRGLEDSETRIDYYYYHKDYGMILYLWDDDNDPDGAGWELDDKIFNSNSTDFSDVPYFNLEKDFAFTRYFVGIGDQDNNNFSQSISYPTTEFNGVKYVTWIQNGIPEEGIRDFEIHMARDTTGQIWVFYFKTDLQTLEFDTLLEARELEYFANEYVHFALMSGSYDSDDIDSASNSYTRNEGGVDINEKITAFDETLDYIPHFQGNLCKVKRWEGATEDDNNIMYFSKRVGLLRIDRNGETGSDAPGWEASHYGGLFDSTDSKDMTEVDYLKATIGNTRSYYGSNELADKDITQTFSSVTVGGLSAFRMIASEEDNSVNLYDIQIVKDNLGVIWVLRYKKNGSSVFYVGSGSQAYLEAKPLSYFADKDMYFKLLCNDYDSSLPYDEENEDTNVNKIAYTNSDSDSITEAIVDFNATLPGIPYYNDDLVLVEYDNLTDPNDSIRWKYYHKDDGLVREIRSETNDVNDLENIDTYRLAWSSKSKPTFNSESSDFSDVRFVYAQPGDIRLMVGQGRYEDLSYLVKYRLASKLGVQCLELYSDLTKIEDINLEESLFVARDTEDDSLWILADYVNDQAVFETDYIDQAVPFERWPDIRWQMCANDDIAVGDSFTNGDITKKFIADELEISQRADLDETVFLLKQTYDPTGDVDNYTYLAQTEGVVLSLYDSFMDPNEPDPNYDDPDMIEYRTADGFYQAEETSIDDLVIRLAASRDRTPGRISDSLVMKGEFDLTAEEFVGMPLTIAVGNWSTTIDTTSTAFKKLSNTLYRYKAIVDGRSIVYLALDLKHDIFLFKAARIDLSGLKQPIAVTMVAGGEIYQNNAELLGKMPVYFNKGTYDTLEAYRYVRRWNESRINDKLVIVGGITASSNIDLTDVGSVTVTWGTTSDDIASKYMVRAGNRNRYYYKDPSGTFRLLLIDWDACAFKVYMVKNSLTAPSSDLTITVTDSDDNTIYSETTVVE